LAQVPSSPHGILVASSAMQPFLGDESLVPPSRRGDQSNPDQASAAAPAVLVTRTTDFAQQGAIERLILAGGLEILLSLGGDALVSPLSIFLAFGMLLHGARGDTYVAMTAALGLTREMLPALADFQNKIVSALDARVAVIIANGVWGWNLESGFANYCRSEFGAEVVTTRPTAAEVNAWAARQTMGKITHILDGDLQDSTLFVNAVYFKGQWSKKFRKDLTRKMPFTLEDGGSVPSMMMTAAAPWPEGRFDYVESETYQAVTLPYGSGAFSAVIILLHRGVTGHLQESELHDIVRGSRFTRMKGELMLPRFLVRFKADLADVMKARGMGVAFTNRAKFAVLEPMKIKTVLHVVFMEVNEEGTEAAAVTAICCVPQCAPRPEPTFRMVCDRPFWFLVRHNATGAVLFLARVTRP